MNVDITYTEMYKAGRIIGKSILGALYGVWILFLYKATKPLARKYNER